jgi:hypothetical protein
MKLSQAAKRFIRAGMALPILLITLALPAAATPSAQAAMPDPAFGQVWSRTDQPVGEGWVARSWIWGPHDFYSTYEPYAQGSGGQHLVCYFDKSRMEVNNPTGDRTSPWFVTNGLLVVEMISGKIQIGDAQFMQARPASVLVAGDAGSANAPTYAALGDVTSLNGDHRQPDRTGQQVLESLNRAGAVGGLPATAGYARYAYYDATLGHNIPDVFWTFMQQDGTVYENGRYVQGRLFDWLFAMGHPITEPYWITIRVQGQDRVVLMQAFQRRILTYSPGNPAGWQVEMGNVGRAYYDWRYSAAPVPPPAPTATPVPVLPAAITLAPSSGEPNAQITVTGAHFPVYAAVTLGLENAGRNYYRTLSTVGAGGDGSFKTVMTLPGDAANLGTVTVTATANGGAIRATQVFTIKRSYDPVLTVPVSEVPVGGQLLVQGGGFPPNTGVKLGIQFPGLPLEWLTGARTSANGAFEVTLSLGNRVAGTHFHVVAVSDDGYKASTATEVRVIAQPRVQITPDTGPVGVTVSLQGSAWPPYRVLNVGMHTPGNQVQVWQAAPIVADGAGNFVTSVWIGQQYTPNSEVHLVVQDPASLLQVETVYRVRGQPVTPPSTAAISVQPATLAVGQVGTISGSGWPAGAVVNLGLSPNVTPMQVQEWLPPVAVNSSGTFATSFVLSAHWQQAGRVIVVGVIPNGPAAATLLTVNPAGRIIPGGLPVTVHTHNWAGSAAAHVQAQGWPAGRAVNVAVVSADGSLNIPVATATVAADGTFAASFAPVATWTGRGDLGVRAATADGASYGVTYFPQATMVKGVGNIYTASGAGWAANTVIEVVAQLQDSKRGETYEQRLGQATSDAQGAWSLAVTVPRLPQTGKEGFEIRTLDRLFSVSFGY